MIPLKLRRVATETHHDEKKQNHFTLQVIFDADIQTLNALISNTTRVLEHSRQLQLPAPTEENPEFDPVDVVDEEDATSPEAHVSTDAEKCEHPEFDEPSILDEPAHKMATDSQIKQIQMIFQKRGFTRAALKATEEEVRELRLKDLSDFFQREIKSSKDLTFDEATSFIKACLEAA